MPNDGKVGRSVPRVKAPTVDAPRPVSTVPVASPAIEHIANNHGTAGVGKYGAPPTALVESRGASAVVGVRSGAINAPASVRGFALPPTTQNVISPDVFLYHDDGRYEWTPARMKQAWLSSWDAFDHALRDEKTERAVLLVGIPGSGKTTWLNENNDSGTVFFDECLCTPVQRKRLIEIANATGKPIDIVWLNPSLETALERNASRPPHRRVREDVLQEWHRLLQEDPPSLTEGVSDVLCVGGYTPPPSHARYSAVFLDDSARSQLLAAFPALHENVFAHHLTLQIRPQESDVGKLQLGETVKMRIVGKADDALGQAVVVQLVGLDCTEPIPHIPISTGTMPDRYASELLTRGFTQLTESLEITGRVGVFMSDGATRFDAKLSG